MNIADMCNLCHDETIIMTQHVVDRCVLRGIEYDDIKRAIMEGEIIEDYPDDYPYPSCLVFASLGTPVHVVAGIGNGYLWIITAYIPNNTKWEQDFKTRK